MYIPCHVLRSLFADLLPVSVSQLRPKAQKLYAQLDAFMKEEVYPREKEISIERSGNEKWQPHPLIEELKVLNHIIHF